MRNHDVARRVAARLRALREARQLSVRALGQRVGLGTEVVSRAERGLQTPTIQTLQRLCEGLEVSLSAFFAEEPEPVPSLAAGRLRRLAALLQGVAPDEQALLLTSLEGVCRALTSRLDEGPVDLPAAAERRPRYSGRRKR